MTMRVLVTGASRGAGRSVAEQLARHGHRVRALVRKQADADRLGHAWAGLGIECVLGDVTDERSLDHACLGMDALVHAAAAVGEDTDGGATFHTVNVGGTGNTWRAAARAGVGHAVLLSTVAIYGRPDVPEVDENAPRAPLLISYDITKSAAETVALETGRIMGLRTVVLRPSLIWGPYDEQFFPRILGALRHGTFSFVGDPDRAMNTTSAANLAHAVDLALRHSDVDGEAFNVTDAELPSWHDAVALVARTARLPVPTRTISRENALRLGTVLDHVRALGIPVPLPFNSFTARVAGARCVYRIDKIRRMLDYRPSERFLVDAPPFIRASAERMGIVIPA